MVKGREVHDRLEAKISELQSHEVDLITKIASSEDEINNLTTLREDIYAKLAFTYLDEAEARNLTGMLKSSQREVNKLFEERKSRRAFIEERLELNSKKRDVHNSEVNNLVNMLNTTEKQRESVLVDIKHVLAEDQTYQEASKNLSFAAASFEQAKKRQDTLARRAPEEIAKFDKNPLFSYLFHKQNFGTDAYSSNLLTARLDPFVAKVINFAEQKQNYEYWRSMPKTISEEAERRNEASL